jgi:hypothetical protein
MTPPNVSSLFSVPSGTTYKPQSISPFDSVAGLADGVVSALQSVLLSPGTGVDQMSLQAVIQGRPDADYQRIINALIKLQHQQFALMKLQMQQPPPPGIDYRALITEVQKVQAQQKIATAQQQQQHGQSLQGRQQQPQTAAQQYQALIQRQFQQQAAAQQQQQQTGQYQAFFSSSKERSPLFSPT